MTFASALSILFIGGTLLATAPAQAQSYPMIELKIDHAKVMRISRPAAMIVIGNPAIADATIKDSQTLIITGKQYGTTNLIVLDSEGEPIADEVLQVSSTKNSEVVVYKGASRRTLTCNPHCERVFRIGDDKEVITDLAAQIQAHGDMAKGEEAQIGGDE